MPTLKILWIAYLMAVSTTLAGPFPAQPPGLLPRKSDGGVLFQCSAPDAKTVYLAGDFNEWAHNDGGRITDPAFAMMNNNGLWNKVVKLDAGIHRFKFNINGDATGWFAPDSAEERDGCRHRA